MGECLRFGYIVSFNPVSCQRQIDSLSPFCRWGNEGYRGAKKSQPPLPAISHRLPSMIMCALEGCAFAGFMAISELGRITQWLCRNKETKRRRNLCVEVQPWPKGIGHSLACELSAEENPATNCSVGLGCIWRMVVRPEQTSLSADLFSGWLVFYQHTQSSDWSAWIIHAVSCPLDLCDYICLEQTGWILHL